MIVLFVFLLINLIEYKGDGGDYMYDTLEALKKGYNEGEKIEYIFFWGHHQKKDGSISKSCFSQWYKSYFSIDGTIYSCMEQYMMAEKARLFNDEEILIEIMKEQEPKKIKDLGRRVKNFDDVLWSQKCQDIVRKGNLAKFEQNKQLKQFLLSTGNKILVEASPFDTIWGIGLSEQAEEAGDPNKWRGTNYLGFALMWVREQLREAK